MVLNNNSDITHDKNTSKPGLFYVTGYDEKFKAHKGHKNTGHYRRSFVDS